MLAALAANPGTSFEPVQIQKLLFLLDENLAATQGKKHFAFEPYDYGPFDKIVYEELETLETHGLVQIIAISGNFSRRKYSLTLEGQEKGEKALEKFEPKAQEYIKNLSNWVRKLSFAQLVGSIYKAYPDMRVNSIFQD